MHFRILRLRPEPALALAALVFAPRLALAQNAPVVPGGAPVADATALVAAPTVTDAPAVFKPDHSTNVTVSAGGQASTGNSNSLAGTVNGVLDMRRGYNGYGAALLGNYARGAPPGQPEVETTENLQGKLRYDRFLGEPDSVFLLTTGRHDKFQGLEFRLNIDPGFKYLFINKPKSALWGEIGYDFQFDVREDNALVQLDPNGNPIPGAPLLSKDGTDHSLRLFAGYRHAFNKEVTLSTGLEYLQSFASSLNTSAANTDYRLNFDARIAAAVGGGFSVGFGFSARYDHDPLPGKVNTDTATTLSLIYAFSDVVKPPVCPCPVLPPAPPLFVPGCPVAPPPPPPPLGAPAAIPAPLPPAPSTWMTPPATTH